MVSVSNHRFSSHHQIFIIFLIYFLIYIQWLVETFLPQTIHFTGLRICLAHNHRPHRIIILFYAEPSEIGNNIVYQCIEVRFMLNDLVSVNITFSDFNTTCQFVKNTLYFFFIDCFYWFSHEFQSIAVCYWLVIIIGINVITEYTPGLPLLF